jgi:hypothetical protein
MDDQPVEVWRQSNLTGQAARAACPRGKVEHIFFILNCGWKLIKPTLVDDYMASGTSHLAFARSLKRLSSGLREIEQALAIDTMNHLRIALGIDERNCDHNIASAA